MIQEDSKTEAGLGGCAVMKAVMAGDLPALEALCQGGQEVNQRDAAGDTPLLKACSGGGFTWHQPEAVEALLAAGADLEAADPSG